MFVTQEILLSQFLFHFLLKKQSINQFSYHRFIFFGDFNDPVKLVNQSFILYVRSEVNGSAATSRRLQRGRTAGNDLVFSIHEWGTNI